MTNADRIRAMSDEELAKFLEEVCLCVDRHECEGCPLEDASFLGLGCSCEQWLKKEVAT